MDNGLVPELCSRVRRQAVVSPWPATLVGNADSLVVGIEIQIAGWLLTTLCGVAGHTASLQNRLHVTEVLDIHQADGLTNQRRRIVDVPLFVSVAFATFGDQWCRGCQIEELVVVSRGKGVRETSRLLAVSVASAAIMPHFAGPQLMPGLSHVKHHAVAVESLERERRVGGDLRQKTRVGIAIRILRLFAVAIELAQRDLAENAKTLHCVAVEQSPAFRTMMPIRRRFHREDTHRVNLVV